MTAFDRAWRRSREDSLMDHLQEAYDTQDDYEKVQHFIHIADPIETFLPNSDKPQKMFRDHLESTKLVNDDGEYLDSEESWRNMQDDIANLARPRKNRKKSKYARIFVPNPESKKDKIGDFHLDESKSEEWQEKLASEQMAPFDQAWDIVKAIDMDEANELAERYLEYYNSIFDDADRRRLAIPPIIMSQTNDPTNTASSMPFTGQEVFRAGLEPEVGRFFSPQRLTADQYAGWDHARHDGTIRPVHSYRLPEIDPSRILRVPTERYGYALHEGRSINDPNAIERLEAAGLTPRSYLNIYGGLMSEGDDEKFSERMQDADYDYVVWPETASSGLTPPIAASIANEMGIRDDLRAKVMQLFGSEGVGGMKGGYPRRYTFPTQWAFMHTGDDESRPIHEMSYEPMELQEWWDRFGASGWR